jgi:hypothetical protein
MTSTFRAGYFPAIRLTTGPCYLGPERSEGVSGKIWGIKHPPQPSHWRKPLIGANLVAAGLIRFINPSAVMCLAHRSLRFGSTENVKGPPNVNLHRYLFQPVSLSPLLAPASHAHYVALDKQTYQRYTIFKLCVLPELAVKKKVEQVTKQNYVSL